jgi:hypothetical protein
MTTVVSVCDTAPSLMLLILSRGKSVQVYRHICPRMLLDPVDHIVDLVITLYGPSHDGWSFGDFHLVQLG